MVLQAQDRQVRDDQKPPGTSGTGRCGARVISEPGVEMGEVFLLGNWRTPLAKVFLA